MLNEQRRLIGRDCPEIYVGLTQVFAHLEISPGKEMSSAVVYIVLILQFSIEWQLCLTCPTKCSCIAATNTVNCTGQRFTMVPYGIPHDTVNLVLHDNFIFELYQTSFANLTNIVYLDLSLNDIVYIENYTFQAMTTATHIEDGQAECPCGVLG
jgi:hypothetical protein